MTFFVSFFIVVIALLASLTLYRQETSDIYLRIFPIFLFVVTILVGLCSYFAYRHINNTSLFNLLTIFQCCFYFFILYRVIHNRIARNIALHLVWIYPLIATSYMVFLQRHGTFHSITYSLGGLLVVGITIFYFLELFQRPQSVNLTRNPDFWICSGLLFYFSCTFPLYGMSNYLETFPVFIVMNLGAIFNVLDILLYLSFSIAFLCRLRIRKSS